ncbi:MAG TPA: hypothetical protein VF815_01155 [Myxococcaceae bacterium]|jgi:hypothetical protein
MAHERKPLYRKVNTKARGVHHASGGDFRHERNTKQLKDSDAIRGRMHGRNDRGLDYTPLFKFLLSSVGRNWDEVYREAVARLDREEPIFWLVALQEKDRQPFVRMGESTYYSGLFVDDANLLQVVDPSVTVETMVPSCGCCTHTFNGVRFTRPYSP